MIDGVKINGIDEDGDELPEEILDHRDDGNHTELVSVYGGWVVRGYIDGEIDWRKAKDDFSEAFKLFSKRANEAEVLD